MVEHLRLTYDDIIEGGETVSDYGWSGYVFATLIPYLNERGVNLGHSSYDVLANELCENRGISIFILTLADRDAYLARLSPEQFSVSELQAYYNEFNACNDGPEAGQAMLDGISALQESLASLDADSVVVFSIG